jgi:hypothetical protein
VNDDSPGVDADAGAGAEPRWGTALACAGAILLITGVLPFVGASPSLLAPLPMPMYVGLMVLGPLAAVLPAAGFLAWTPQLRIGNGGVPRRSVVLLAVLAALNAWWSVAAWSYGLRYQGIGYTRMVLAASAGWIVVLAGLCAWVSRRPSLAKSWLFHALLFAWLGWYAFPFLGELP